MQIRILAICDKCAADVRCGEVDVWLSDCDKCKRFVCGEMIVFQPHKLDPNLTGERWCAPCDAAARD